MKIQTHQIKSNASLPNLGVTKSETGLDEILNALNLNSFRPLKITANGTTSISIAGSGPSSMYDGTKLILSPVNNNIVLYSGEDLNITTGIFSGVSPSFTPTPTSPTMFRALALMLNANGSIQAVYGSEEPDFNTALANAPAFLSNTYAASIIILSADGSGAYKPVKQSDVIQFIGGSGGGEGSGLGAAISPADGFKAILVDQCNVATSDANSKMDATLTTASLAGKFFTLLCDKSKTVTTTGTTFTLNSAPGFPLAAGDILYANNQFRKILSFSGTTGTIDVAFSTDLLNSSCMLSQAVWTLDLINYGDALNETRLRDYFPSESCNSVSIDYNDSLSGAITEKNHPARIAVVGTNIGTQSTTTLPSSDKFDGIYTRPTGVGTIQNYNFSQPLGSDERLFLCFFCNPNEPAVLTGANLLDYKVSVYQDEVLQRGGVFASAFCYSDGSATPQNCQNPVVVGGLTELELNFSYLMHCNPNTTAGQLVVEVDGQTIPRKLTGTTQGAWYEEVTPTRIRFFADMSVTSAAIRVLLKEGGSDYDVVNASKIQAMYNCVVGSAAQVSAGVATHSSITSAIADLPNNGVLLILGGNYTENINLNKSATVIGQGYATNITGNITVASSNCSIRCLRLIGNVSFSAGANRNYFTESWQNAVGTVSDLGLENSWFFLEA